MRVEKETIYQLKNETEQDKGIEIDPEFLRKIQIIAEVVGGDFGMKVEMGKPGGGSFFNGIEKKITLDPLHIKEDPQLAVFVSAHEGGHRAITRGPHELGLKDEKINEISSELGFAFGFNCCEDPADNNWVENKFTGLKENVDNVYDKMLEKDNIPLGLDHPEIRQLIATLGYVPKFTYFGSEIIRYWHQDRFSKGLSDGIKSALEKVKNNCREYFESIPSSKKTEKETIEKARERFLNFYQNIWPEMKKIVELDIDDEKLRQMANEMMDDLMKQLDKKSKKELEDALSQGQKQFKNEMEGAQKSQKGSKKEKGQLEKKIQELKEKLKDAQGEEKKNLEKELNEKEGEKEQNRKKQEELEKELEQMQERSESGNKPIPMDQLSQELKEKLQEIFDSLPQDKREKLEQQAEENLEALEDKLNQETEGKLNLDKIESHQEKKDQTEKEQKEVEKTQKERKEIERARQETQERIEKEMNEYDKYYQEVKSVVENLYQELLKIFLPKRHPRWKRGYPSGSRLDLLKAMQFEADKSKHTEIWERKTIPQKIDYRFSLLVDLSGSMRGEKIRETFKGMIVLSEVLNRIGIKHNIIGFQDKPISFKDFNENLDKQKRNLLSGMLREPNDRNPGGNNQAAYNSDGFCLDETAKELDTNKGRDNFLVILSDGLPDPDSEHSGTEYELSRIVKQIRENTDIKLIGLGLGSGTEHVRNYYPNSLPNIAVEDLPETLSQLLEDVIKNPSKY